MQKGLIRKGLVFSVIVLFIGVGVNPAFAEESITTTLDSEKDCIECQVSEGYNPLRMNLLSIKTKVIANLILLKFGDIPEIKEKCQEILDEINIYYPLDYPIICDTLSVMMTQIENFGDYFMEIIRQLKEISYLLAQLVFWPVALIIDSIYTSIFITGIFFDCWEP